MNELSLLNKRIKSLRQKIKVWFLIDGLSRLVIFLLIYLFLAFWIDYLIRDLPVIPRLCFLGGAISIFFLTLFRKVVFPLIRLTKIPDDSLILLIEKQFPVLNERLINLWQLSPRPAEAKPEITSGRQCESIIPELTKEVTSISQHCDFTRILFPAHSQKLLFSALVLSVLSILSLTFYPIELMTWGQRLLGSPLQWPKRTTLAVKVIPDYTIAKGQDLSVIAWADKGPHLGSVYIRTDANEFQGWQRMLLTEKIDSGATEKRRSREFRYDFVKIQSSFRFMVKGGDDQTPWVEIKVLNAPVLEKITLLYDYPDYTGLASKIESGGNIKAPRGTKVTFNGFSNIKLSNQGGSYWILDSFQQPLTVDAPTGLPKDAVPKAGLFLERSASGMTRPVRDDVPENGPALPSGGSVITGTFIVEKDTKYSIHLLGTNGLKNVEPIEYPIKSIPDNYPVIKVLEPANESEYVTPEATFPLEALLTDDYGISNAQIKVLINLSQPPAEKGKELWINPSLIKTTLPSNTEPQTQCEPIKLTHNLDLSSFALKEGAYVILNFVATDNCGEPAPQTTTSTDYSLIIISKPSMEKRVEENILQLKDDIKKSSQMQEAAKQAGEIQSSLSNQRRVTQNLTNISSLLSKIVHDINNNRLFPTTDISEKLTNINKTINELYNNKSPAISQLLEKIATTKDDKSLRATASAKQQEITDDLAKILNSLEEWEDYQEVVSLARELLATTQKISEKIKISDNPSELEKDRLIDQAKNLQKESENLEAKMVRVSEKLKTAHPYYSEKLREGLQRLKQPVSGPGLNENILSLISYLYSSLKGQAIKTSENIAAILASLIDFLEDRINPEEIKQKLDELTKMLDKVNDLKNKEEEIYGETAKTLDPTEETLALAQELDSLLLDQKALNEVTSQIMNQNDTKKLAEALKKLAKAQRELKAQANNLTNRLRNAENKMPDTENKNHIKDAGQSIQQASDKMSESAKNLAERKSRQERDKLRPDDFGKESAQTDSRQISDDQKDALQKLRQARDALQQFLNRQLTEEEKRTLEKLARRQKELKDETNKSSEEDDKNRESLQNAAQKMAQAQNSLSNHQPQKAQQDEQEALEELERLYERLAQKIDDLNQKQKEETIEQLHAMLTKILESQININSKTAELLILKSDIKSRENIIIIKKLSSEQLDLSEECNTVQTKLKDEKSVVFTWTLNSVRDDMQLVSRLLQEVISTETPQELTYIREIQIDITRKLKELLAALQFEKNCRKPLQVDTKEGEEEGANKLLPLLSELKMLKTMQENLMSRTEASRQDLINIIPDDKNAPPAEGNSALVQSALGAILQRLAAEQGHLAEMAKDLTQRIKEEQSKHQQP